MNLGLMFRERLSGVLYVVQEELDQVIAGITGGWGIEHKPDGTHGDVTADSVTADEATVSGAWTHGGPWGIGRAAVLTPTELTSNQNNYNPAGFGDAVVVRLSSATGDNITGLAAPSGTNVTVKLLINVGNANIVLVHNSASSTATNRFSCPGGVSVTLNEADSAWVVYDSISGIWRVVGV